MIILGIETSCDETGVSLLSIAGPAENPSYQVLASALHSQAGLHAGYGGVFPALAKREHAKNLPILVRQVLSESGLGIPRTGTDDAVKHRMDTHLSRNPDLKTGLDSLIEEMGIKDIDAIAVTSGPGLEPALWVGIAGALALGAAWDIPVYPVDHMEGHFLSVVGSHGSSIEYPALALLISGGHTEFIAARTPFAYEKIGRTRDDAVGEAFDKVARLLNLPYPGGPELSALAEKARESAIFSEITLPRPMLNSGDLDFSFSGLKTAVRYAIAGKELNDAERMGIAREFEDAVRDVLKKKAADAIHVFKPVTFIVAGGVSQNGGIRADLEEIMDGAGIHFLAPQAGLAGDNAIMIALASYSHVLQGKPPRTITAAGAQELGVHKNPA